MSSSRPRSFWGWMLLICGGILLLNHLTPEFLGWSTFLIALGVALFYFGMRRDRGSIFPATFLILLGLFFLLHEQEVLEFEWWQGWPLLLIFLGISFITLYCFNPQRRHALFPGVILIIVGFIFFLYPHAWEEILYQAGRYWPVLLIIVGVYLIWKSRKQPRQIS